MSLSASKLLDLVGLDNIFAAKKLHNQRNCPFSVFSASRVSNAFFGIATGNNVERQTFNRTPVSLDSSASNHNPQHHDRSSEMLTGRLPSYTHKGA